MKLLTIAAALLGLSACVVYDEELVYDDTGMAPLPDRPGEGVDENIEAAVSVFPTGGLVGERALISLYATGGVDLNQIVDVTFLGDSELTIRTRASRSGSEYLLAVDIPIDSVAATNHLLLGMADGTTLFVEEAFTVAADTAMLPMSPNPPTCK